MPTRRRAMVGLCAAITVFIAPALAATPALAAAGQTVDVGKTAEQLVQEIVGTGISSVSNASYTGAAEANGIFTGMDGIGIGSGIVLSSGSAAAVVGPNDSGSTSRAYGLPGDPALDSIAGATTHDAATLEFDFVPVSSPLTFTYLYGSDEYPEWVNQGYNDAFAMVVNGVNCAVVPGTSTPITIDTINAGANAEYFVDGTGSEVTQMDGYTTPLVCTATVTPRVSNHFRFSIADGGDEIYDSWALIASGTLATNVPPTTQPVHASTSSGIPVATTLLGDAGGDPISYSYSQPAHGTLSGTAPNLVYVSLPTFTGVDTFSYTATTTAGTSAPSTVTITVTAPALAATGADGSQLLIAIALLALLAGSLLLSTRRSRVRR